MFCLLYNTKAYILAAVVRIIHRMRTAALGQGSRGRAALGVLFPI